ncbi:MAG: MFS transporter [Pseudomonadota bacterium]
MPLLAVAIIAMLAQQTMATVSKTGVPVLFKPVADDLGFAAELVLVYTWTFACVGILVMLGCGAFITRYGALRMTQVGCLSMAAGLTGLALVGQPLWLAAALLGGIAVTVSGGATVSTPASSQILARYSPARWAPLVFSIKQAGVPAGIVIASFAAPALTEAYGWRTAGLVLAAACVVIAFALQLCRAEFDRERKPSHPLRLAGLRDTFLEVLRTPRLRSLAMAAFAFIGLQAIYTNFTVVYLAEELGYSLSKAGAMLGFATLIAAPGRIFWGWVSSVWVSPRALLVALALAMSVGAAAMGFYQPDWPYWLVMTPLLVVSATALSWHGILLSETARLAPSGEVGRVTGGVLAFGTAGQIAFPLLFGIGLLLGGYPLAYIAVGCPALLTALLLMRPQPEPA